MVKHIILWELNKELSEEEKASIKAEIKEKLEGLVGAIPDLKAMNIRTQFLDSSSADIMMDSEFTDEAALKAYQTHPLHVDIASNLVRPNVSARLSMDYEI